jgi:ankyrin repeat protein
MKAYHARGPAHTISKINMSNNPFLQHTNGGDAETGYDGFAVKEADGGTSTQNGHQHADVPNGFHAPAENVDAGQDYSVAEVSPRNRSSFPAHATLIDIPPRSPQSKGNNLESLPGAVQDLQLEDQFNDEIQPRSHHAHVPSFSHVRRESLPVPRPTYVRALSSHISEAPTGQQMNPGEAHAEVLRRLGKAERVGKTIKRRGSNESLSSLISYSIRRPSVPARPESGHSMDSLATVLEEAAQEGNLPLVEATMALGANPNFRSVHRLKNRRHDALNKATAAGHVHVIDYLLKQGSTYNLGESAKKDVFSAMDYKLLDVAYSGYGDVARYLISTHGANPFTEQWPREYFDATRTVYRRVIPAKMYQRTVLDAIARMGNAGQDMDLLQGIMAHQAFDPTAICSRVYEDKPYEGDGTRMSQTVYHYSALSAFVKAGLADAVEAMLEMNSSPAAYQKQEKVISEEGQLPSSHTERYVYPANSMIKDTWLYRRQDALRILSLLIKHDFDLASPQRTADDSAPRTLLSRAILANAADGVDMLLSARPDLVKEDVAFRLLLQEGTESEYKAQPLAAAIVQGSLETARVILKSGASPRDAAFSYKHVTCFAAGHGGATATAILADLIKAAPELLSDALETAIAKAKPDAVRVLLGTATRREVQEMCAWDMVNWAGDVGGDEEFNARVGRIRGMVGDVLGVEGKGETRVSMKEIE